MQFESNSELEARRAEKRRAREEILDEAKRKYEIEERKISAAKARGEDTWMLPELSESIDREAKKLKKKAKKLKKEKKNKHDKKSKKAKKRKSSSSSESNDSDEELWVEKTKGRSDVVKPETKGGSDVVKPQTKAGSEVVKPQTKGGSEVVKPKTKGGSDVVKPLTKGGSEVVIPQKDSSTDTDKDLATVKGPKLERDDWMILDSANIPTISRLELREKIKQDKLQYVDRKEEICLNEPGQHNRELNPYWKSGTGTGLPEEQQTANNSSVPKHNLAFLKKAYARCEELAEETGQSLEDVASERYGSLEQLQTMVMEAERTEEMAKTTSKEDKGSERKSRSCSRERNSKSSDSRRSNIDRDRDRSSRNRRRSRDNVTTRYRRSSSNSRERFRRGGRDRSASGDRNRHSNRSTSRDRGRSRRNRSSSRDKDQHQSGTISHSRDRNGSNHETRSRDRHKNRSKSRERRRSRSRSRERHRSRSPGASNSRHRRSYERARRDRSSSHSPSKSPPTKKRFMKPGSSEQPPLMPKTKRAFLKPGETAPDTTQSGDAGRPSWKKPGHDVKVKPEEPSNASDKHKSEVKEKVAPSESVRSSSSSEGSSSSDSESEEEQELPTIVALTDDEMNALGAKLLKAELMGNDEVAKELKERLEKARQAGRASGVKSAPAADKEKVVVLSRTDKFGNIRPVQSHDPDLGKGGGKRRKAKKIQTHDNSGERQRYFADDDHFNIKDMVQAEKMTSAEDQQLMFSKMAAKITEKIDDDNQIDDAMISRARLEEDPTKVAAQQQHRAMADSRKMTQTLDNCQHCLDNMTKHLIIAVAKNTYLCLPEYQSLCEGHCRIVPMHHCISSTVCDEDVWNEVQEFRRTLVRMFTENGDQDCVFMECSKNLRKQPHMVVDCIPIERELGDMAPIYFKKAIDESEKEWAQNKKLVDLSKKDIRHSIPKGFPYFAVDFGMQGGFAHVIEDEQSFPAYFGKEVVGGMMDVDQRLWRKPRKESFEDQRKKVMNFFNMWKPYDFTKKKADSDSD